MRVYGLYRDAEAVVYDLYKAIKDDDSGSNPFDLVDKDEKEHRRVLAYDPTSWALPFVFELPLREPIELPVIPDE